MRKVVIILVSCLLLYCPFVFGQESNELLFDGISSIRLKMERLNDSRREAIAQRDKLSSKLDYLVEEIDKRKAERRPGRLIPDFTLQNLLQQSQELSDTLTLLNRELEALDTIRRDQLEKLDSHYERLVERTAKEIRRSKGERQNRMVKELTRLRRERKSIKRELLAGSRPVSPMKTGDLLASEDPEELLERVDAVRDEQDRLRKRLAFLDKRIVDAKSQIRLDREMRDFVEDQALFGEESRLLQVSKTTTHVEADPNRNPGVDETGDKQEEPAPSYLDDADGAFDGMGGECTGGMCGTPEESWAGKNEAPPEVIVTETVEGAVPMGVDTENSPLDHLSPAQRLRALNKRRKQIVHQIKKLQILHDRIQEKVESLRDE